VFVYKKYIYYVKSLVLFEMFVYVYWVFSHSFIVCNGHYMSVYPIYVLIGAGHQGIMFLYVS